MSGSAKVIGAIDVASLFDDIEEDLEGYYTVLEIAVAAKRSECTVGAKMRKLRTSGKVECAKVKRGSHLCWVYKVKL